MCMLIQLGSEDAPTTQAALYTLISVYYWAKPAPIGRGRVLRGRVLRGRVLRGS